MLTVGPYPYPNLTPMVPVSAPVKWHTWPAADATADLRAQVADLAAKVERQGKEIAELARRLAKVGKK